MSALIDQEDHPEMVAAYFELKAYLQRVTTGRYPSRQLYADIIQVRDDHRARWRARGVDFPLLVMFSVPRLLVIEYWRADLDFASIRVKLMNFVMLYPTVTPKELASALKAAYPDFADRALTDEGEAMLERIAEKKRLALPPLASEAWRQ
jgi:hypothetical protein